jgi:general secretion pathway protein J
MLLRKASCYRNHNPFGGQSLNHKASRQQGFTLIEVLVAIAVFASLSVAAYTVLNQVQRSNAQSMSTVEDLQQFQKAWAIIDSDFRQMALRQWRHEGESPSEYLLAWGQGVLDSEQNGVMFTRLGYSNPLSQLPRGEVTKVGYLIQNEKLQRVWWRYPDTSVGEPSIERTLLSGVESFELEFYNGEGWLKEWAVKYELPYAIKMTLQLEKWGSIERLYLITQGRVDTAEAAEEGGSE